MNSHELKFITFMSSFGVFLLFVPCQVYFKIFRKRHLQAMNLLWNLDGF